METVGHVDVAEVRELLGLLYLLEWVRYLLIDVLANFTVVATRSDERVCSFRSYNQG